MKTVRLNSVMRKTILDRLMEQGFAERRGLVEDEMKELGDDVYDHAYPKSIVMKMKRLPPDFFPEVGEIKVSFGGEVAVLPITKPRLVAHKHQYYGNVVGMFGGDHPYTESYSRLKAEERKLDQEESTAKQQARAVLASVATLRQLLEVWPERGPLVEDLTLRDLTSVALAVPMVEFSQTFGLGREK